MRNRTILSALHILIVSLTASTAHAFYTVQETGDLLKPEERQFAAEVQFVTSGDKGINLVGRFDMGFDEESNFRFLAGTGTTDFQLGAFFKWVPFPDFEKQPAIGFTMGAHLAGYEGENELAGRLIPFVSKKFDTELGELTPYASIPVAFSNYDDDSRRSPIQFVVGSRYRHPEFIHADFSAELGFDLNDAFTYISLGVILPAF